MREVNTEGKEKNLCIGFPFLWVSLGFVRLSGNVFYE